MSLRGELRSLREVRSLVLGLLGGHFRKAGGSLCGSLEASGKAQVVFMRVKRIEKKHRIESLGYFDSFIFPRVLHARVLWHLSSRRAEVACQMREPVRSQCSMTASTYLSRLDELHTCTNRSQTVMFKQVHTVP